MFASSLTLVLIDLTCKLPGLEVTGSLSLVPGFCQLGQMKLEAKLETQPAS